MANQDTQIPFAADILVVDDDNGIRELLSRTLTRAGYNVYSAKDAFEAHEIIYKDPLDLLIVDVLMPKKDGRKLVQEIRDNPPWPYPIPVLMLTALNAPDDRVMGLESGADDYLAKLFDPRELLLRVAKLLGRALPQKEASESKPRTYTKFGEYVYNRKTGGLRKNGVFVALSSSELELLNLFVDNLNIPISREFLSQNLNHISERSIDVQVNRLRRKIEIDPKKPIYLQTAWGQGYVLRDIEK